MSAGWGLRWASPCLQDLCCPLQFVDTDSILTNNQTLKFLMAQNKSVVAPMLDSQTFYSNFWCGITPQVRPQKAPGKGTLPILKEPPTMEVSLVCCRGTTAGQPTTSPPRTGSRWAALLSPWSMPPS